MKEINREYYGGGDGKAINRHSVRTYIIHNERIYLDRNLSTNPNCFSIWYFPGGRYGLATYIPVDNKQFFGDGLPWSKIIPIAEKAINKYFKK